MRDKDNEDKDDDENDEDEDNKDKEDEDDEGGEDKEINKFYVVCVFRKNILIRFIYIK